MNEVTVRRKAVMLFSGFTITQRNLFACRVRYTLSFACVDVFLLNVSDIQLHRKSIKITRTTLTKKLRYKLLLLSIAKKKADVAQILTHKSEVVKLHFSINIYGSFGRLTKQKRGTFVYIM